MQFRNLATLLLATLVAVGPTMSWAKTTEKTKTASSKKADVKKAAAPKSAKASSTKQTQSKKAENSHKVTEKPNTDKAKQSKKPAKTHSQNSSKAQSTGSNTRKQAVSKKTKSAKNHKPVRNETQALYGVKGAKLQHTKVIGKKYSYHEKGKTHTTIGKDASRAYSQVGVASYYGGKFNGRKTSNGEIFNENLFTAAHKTLALGSYAIVTNLRNHKKVIVRINDRGPFSHKRIIDLSKGAARELGMIHSGIATVRVDAMQVDSQGYIIGKGAHTLYQIAKKAGLPLKVKANSSTLAIKADDSPRNAHRSAVFQLKAVTNSEKEAKKLAKQLKQPTRIERVNKQYAVIISVKNQTESQQLKKQIAKLGKYQIFSYSEK